MPKIPNNRHRHTTPFPSIFQNKTADAPPFFARAGTTTVFGTESNVSSQLFTPTVPTQEWKTENHAHIQNKNNNDGPISLTLHHRTSLRD